MPKGVGFGPLKIAVPDLPPTDEPTVVAIDELVFLPDDSASASLAALGVGGIAGVEGARDNDRDEQQSSEPDRSPTTRRRLLVAAAALAGSAAFGRVASSQSDGDTDPPDLLVARTNVIRSDGPFWIGVLDVIDGVLPDGTIYLDHSGSREDSFSGGGNGETLAAGTTGEVEVYLSGGKGFIDRLFAWARGVLSFGETLDFEFRLEKRASEHAAGTVIMVSSHPAVLEPVDENPTSDVTVSVGGATIPYDGSSSGQGRGKYDVRTISDGDRALIYDVGEDAPDSDTLTVSLDSGWFGSL